MHPMTTDGDDLDARFIGTASSVLSDEILGAFISANEEDVLRRKRRRKFCVITSGGTQAALEKRVVRSLENFSSGMRGARMTEAIMDQSEDYSVILLVRKGAALPYAHNFTVKNFSDALSYRLTDSDCAGILISHEARRAVKRMHEVISEKRLLVVEYVSVQEYILTLRHIAMMMKSRALGERTMICLAAAVSDFYVPEDNLSLHKLQATQGELVLRLSAVPKCLGLLRLKWAPANTFIVSFKLETDVELLIPKSRVAIKSYGVDLVVGNILETRYEKVTLIDGESAQLIMRPKNDGGDDDDTLAPIEGRLVNLLTLRHTAHSKR